MKRIFAGVFIIIILVSGLLGIKYFSKVQRSVDNQNLENKSNLSLLKVFFPEYDLETDEAGLVSKVKYINEKRKVDGYEIVLDSLLCSEQTGVAYCRFIVSNDTYDFDEKEENSSCNINDIESIRFGENGRFMLAQVGEEVSGSSGVVAKKKYNNKAYLYYYIGNRFQMSDKMDTSIYLIDDTRYDKRYLEESEEATVSFKVKSNCGYKEFVMAGSQTDKEGKEVLQGCKVIVSPFRRVIFHKGNWNGIPIRFIFQSGKVIEDKDLDLQFVEKEEMNNVSYQNFTNPINIESLTYVEIGGFRLTERQLQEN